MSKYDEESAELCEALDALDAAHAEEVREAREDGYQEGLRDARANLVADRREGWVELPRDADGVRWTGEEREFADSDGRRGGCVGLLWLGDEWAVMDSLPHDFVTDAPGMCRHVPDADTPASLADELEAWCDRLREAAESREDVTLFGVDYVALPLDADGVPIHVGDVLTDGEYTFRVDELAAFGDGSWSIRNEDGNAWAACDVTHHHAPTVETTLREMLEQAVGYSDAHTTVALNAIAECAKRLRLAGDAE